jgi:glyoxalase family protein
MNSRISGIHHVTAIASDPQANVDFYAGLLGLRLVKKTVNFDDPSAYHLYYGDETGAPGTIVTFFYWPGGASGGRVGSGQMTRLSFSAPPASLDFWQERLQRHGIPVERHIRFEEDVITFVDPDAIPVEIVAVSSDPRQGWTGSEIPAEHALRGLLTAELTVRSAEPTEQLLTREMGFSLVRRERNRARFEAGDGGPGAFVDVITHPSPSGLGGVGTIHHIAWRVADDSAELAMQEHLSRVGYGVSPVRDRTYFRSIYYRENGGILFEIATDVPGFASDESMSSLGTELKLPSQFEHARKQIEALLPPLQSARTSSANLSA